MTGAQDTLPMLLSNTLFCLSRQPGIWDHLPAEVACVGPDALTIEEARMFQLLRNIPNECTWPALPDLHDLANSDGRSSSTLSGRPCPLWILHYPREVARRAIRRSLPLLVQESLQISTLYIGSNQFMALTPIPLTQMDGILFSPGLGRI